MNEIKKYTIEDYRQWKTYKNDLEEGKKKWLLAGWKLKQIKDTKAYIEDGCKDFNEFITREKIGKSTAYSLIGIVEYFQLTESNALDSFDLSFHRAQKILPVVKSNPKKKDEIIELARTIESEKELMEELAIYRKRSIHTEVEKAVFKIEGSPEDIEFIKKTVEEISQTENIPAITVIVNCLQYYLEVNDKKIDENKSKINKLSRQFSDLFLAKHQQYRKAKYMFRGVRDKLLCDKLVSTFTMEELEKALDKFFTKEKKWWHNYNLGAFYTAVNELVGEDVKVPSVFDKYDKIIEKAKRKYQQGEDDE